MGGEAQSSREGKMQGDKKVRESEIEGQKGRGMMRGVKKEEDTRTRELSSV